MKVFYFIFVCLVTLTQQGCTKYPITKVFKQNKSNYSLNNSNTWRDYPDLKVSFELAQPRLVFISYTITIGSSGLSHLVTRLIVDSEEIKKYRAISGNTVYHTNSVSGYVFLMDGTHNIAVQYRTPGTFTVNSAADWVTAQIQVVF